MKPGGSIVNISSIHAYKTSPNVAPYAAGKAALSLLTRQYGRPMPRHNPNVQSKVEKIDKTNLGQPNDVAEAVAYLASDAAAFVQGTKLRVGGGRLVRLSERLTGRPQPGLPLGGVLKFSSTTSNLSWQTR